MLATTGSAQTSQICRRQVMKYVQLHSSRSHPCELRANTVSISSLIPAWFGFALLLILISSIPAPGQSLPFKRSTDDERAVRRVYATPSPLPGVSYDAARTRMTISSGFNARALNGRTKKLQTFDRDEEDRASLPHWEGSFRYGGEQYEYTMIGTDPARGSVTTVIPTEIIALRLVFTNTVPPVAPNTALDPNVDTNGGQTILNATRNSPIFQSASFAAGSTNLGFTQFGDAYQRGNFWNFVSTRSSDYHVLLDQPQIITRTINVPFDKGQIAYFFGTTTLIAEVDMDWFDQQLQGLLTTLHIDPASLPIFLTHNLLLAPGPIPNDPVAIGYHEVVRRSGNARERGDLQTYIEAAYLDEHLSVNVSDALVLSHELAEWMDDPFVNNLVPFWQFPFSFPDFSLRCFGSPDHPGKGLLEVGDPLESPGFPVIPVTTNGTTYHLQDEAFLSWFTRESPSKAVNGWYTLGNSWDVFSEPCVNITDYTYETVDVPGARRTSLSGINNKQDVVGRYRDAAGQSHAFVRKDGLITTIDPPGAMRAEASKVNDSGDIVGDYRDVTGKRHAFLLKRDGFSSLDVPGAIATFALGINNPGTVVGGYVDAIGIIHGFTWQNGQFRTVEVPFAFQEQIEAINDEGEMVGDWDITGADDESFGFISNGARFRSLNFPGSFFTSLTSLNNEGIVVGWYEFKIRTPFFGDDFSVSAFIKHGEVFDRIIADGAPDELVADTALVGNNDAGQAVGSYFAFSPSGLALHGVIVTPRRRGDDDDRHH